MKTTNGKHGRRSQAFSVSTVSNIGLSNQGHLAVYTVDSGSMLSRQYGNTSFLIVKGLTHVLIDCGFTIPQALTRFGVNLSQVRTTVLTHEHADHVGGFQAIATANRADSGWCGEPKLQLLSHPYLAGRLWNHSFGGLTIDDREPLPDKWYKVIYPNEVDEQGGVYTFRFQGLSIKLVRTAHTPSDAVSWKDSAWSTAVVIDNKVLITGDTRFDRALLDRFFADDLSGVEVIFHDVSSRQSGVHASFDELCALPLAIKTNMYLSHPDDGFANSEMKEKVHRLGFRGMTHPGHLLEFKS